MPQASTKEFACLLRDLLDTYAARCTPMELLGALVSAQFEVWDALQKCNEEEGQ